MVDAKLDAVSNVQIDDGIFKYVLIKVYGKENADGTEKFKFIVRGFERAEWHGEFTGCFGTVSAFCIRLFLASTFYVLSWPNGIF